MAKASISSLLGQLKKDGFAQKAIVSHELMAELCAAFDLQKGVIDTAAEELRYIEGLAELPFRYLTEFKILPAPGRGKCTCGRTPSALEIVSTALRRKVHDKSLIRDTLIGFENLVEIAQAGRIGECVACGRPIPIAAYRKKDYMYA